MGSRDLPMWALNLFIMLRPALIVTIVALPRQASIRQAAKT